MSKLFCFSSKNVENIRRGIQAKRWAVAQTSASTMKGRATKANNYFRTGSYGLLYCTETQSFTTPFIAASNADPHSVVADIWPERWVLPFSIEPLGDLRKQMSKDLVKVVWPMLAGCGSGGAIAALNATGTTVFVTTEISEADWSIVLSGLAT